MRISIKKLWFSNLFLSKNTNTHWKEKGQASSSTSTGWYKDQDPGFTISPPQFKSRLQDFLCNLDELLTISVPYSSTHKMEGITLSNSRNCCEGTCKLLWNSAWQIVAHKIVSYYHHFYSYSQSLRKPAGRSKAEWWNERNYGRGMNWGAASQFWVLQQYHSTQSPTDSRLNYWTSSFPKIFQLSIQSSCLWEHISDFII